MTTNPKSRLARAARAGFTLIELLAVILILGILTAVLVTNLGDADEAARVQQTRAQIAKLSAAINSYESDRFGDYPPSRFSDEQGVSNEGFNVGVEALVAALWSNGYDAGGLLEDEADRLDNTDGDASSRNLTDFPSRELFELVDAWGNPLAYFHNRDYSETSPAYVTFDPVTGEELESVPRAAKNTTTGLYYAARSFQLVSAGPDALFGTEDDVTNLGR